MTGTVYKDSIIRCQSNTMDVTVMVLLFFALLSPLINSSAVDTIRENQTIRDGETITSSGGEFELGFFSPGRSRYRYLGIWYKKISSGTVVWVANRNAPIMNNLSMVRVDDKGITLQTVNGIIWSSNTSVSMKNPVAQILDSGNLVLRDDDHGIDNFIWQSFDYPGDIMLPGMKFGLDLVTGLDRYFTSWKSIDDPSTGNFTNRIDPNGFPQSFVLKGSVKWHRFGPWNGRQFSGTPNGNLNGIYTEAFVINEKEIYYKFDLIEASSAVIRFILTSSGWTELLVWNYENQSWKQFAAVRVSGCDRYRLCGAYGVCNINGSPRCECLREFVPKFPEKWTSNWSGGCVREKKIDCRSDATFMKYSGVKLPDTRHSWYDMKTNLAECRRLCLQNCSCTAYANADIRRGGSGCILWFDHLIDMMGYTEDGQDIYVKMPASELVEGQRSKAKRPNFIFLIPLAWKSYNDDKLLGVIDEVMLDSCNLIKVFRVIHIGLLCVQEDPVERPIMSEVVLMLSSNMKLPHPKKPGFFMERRLQDTDHLLSNHDFSTCNQFTITSIVPRQ
uniref:Uncharacterized protein n=1 Tax=Daucus carota subsp. sativus TaxID=79200 RepID=A0A166IME5_DAUCS